MNDDTRPESDAFSALGWGLRRYFWVVLDAMLLLGVLLPGVLLNLSSDEFEARAQLGPASKLVISNVDILPRTGSEIFTNGAVSEAVANGVEVRPGPVIPNTVELVAAQDSYVMTILGRGADAESAEEAANVAAGTFVDELNKSSAAIGTFEVQRPANGSAVSQPRANGLPLVVGGLAAGLVVGIGIVAAILAWRRPVLGSSSARKVTGKPVLATLEMDPGKDEIQGLHRLCHSLLHDDSPVVFLTGPRSAREDRHRLTTELRSVLAGPRSVTVLAGSHQSFWGLPPEKQRAAGGTDLLIVDGPTQAELTMRPPESLTLLVVPVGIPTGALQRETENYLDDGKSGVVMIRQVGRLRTLFTSRSSSSDEPSAKG